MVGSKGTGDKSAIGGRGYRPCVRTDSRLEPAARPLIRPIARKKFSLAPTRLAWRNQRCQTRRLRANISASTPSAARAGPHHARQLDHTACTSYVTTPLGSRPRCRLCPSHSLPASKVVKVPKLLKHLCHRIPIKVPG